MLFFISTVFSFRGERSLTDIRPLGEMPHTESEDFINRWGNSVNTKKKTKEQLKHDRLCDVTLMSCCVMATIT